ncbi:MAG: preprotein translocase subunit SecG [Clostridiales bacterium]|nr:preprotein translocase subunit SecG [Clostridiales bacterium]
MQVLMIILYIVMAVSAVSLITVVLLQPGQAGGVGALTGQSEASFGRNSTRSFEQKLAKWTKITAAVLFVLSFSIALFEKLL